MISKYKILNEHEIVDKIKSLKAQGKNIVLCHGHFNVIHPGHLRFLNFAKKQGDFLLISILHPNDISPSIKNTYYGQEERAMGVAALEMVDAVYQLPGSIIDFINLIKPNIYAKGREFEKNQLLIKDEIEAVQRNKGKVIFSSGDIEYSSNESFNKLVARPNSHYQSFINVCLKHSIDYKKIINTVNNFQKLNMLVIGDTIVDQFVACDTLGVSSEAPVLAIKELNSREYIGGAAIIAQHVKSLGAKCHYISVIGNDSTGGKVIESLATSGITAFLPEDETRPTTFKIRYMVENQKILRVSKLKQHEINSEIESLIIERIKELIPQMDGIIISDFVYGVITPTILEEIKILALKHNVLVFADLQCSSQIGDVTKFTNISLITPTEKEARIALRDHTSGLEKLANDLHKSTKNDSIVITLGSMGLLACTFDKTSGHHISEHFPALESNPVDVAGAGDSLLSGYSLGLTSNLNIMESSALGSCLAAISVMRLGNIPIMKEELITFIKQLVEFQNNLQNRI